jgi:hypothetical protein
MVQLKERLPTAPTKLAIGVGMAVALLLGGCGDASPTRGATGWSGDEPRLDDDRSPGASGSAGTAAADAADGEAAPGSASTVPNAVLDLGQPQLQNPIQPPAQLSVNNAGDIANHNPVQLGVNNIASMQIQGPNQGGKLSDKPQQQSSSQPQIAQQQPVMNSAGSSNAKGGMLAGAGHLIGGGGAEQSIQDPGRMVLINHVVAHQLVPPGGAHPQDSLQARQVVGNQAQEIQAQLRLLPSVAQFSQQSLKMSRLEGVNELSPHLNENEPKSFGVGAGAAQKMGGSNYYKNSISNYHGAPVQLGQGRWQWNMACGSSQGQFQLVNGGQQKSSDGGESLIPGSVFRRP